MATLDIRQINNSAWVRNEKAQAMLQRQAPTPSTLRLVTFESRSVLLAPNLGTLSSQLRSAYRSWPPQISWDIIPKSSKTAIQVNSLAPETGWGCISLRSDFRNTRTGRLTLRGLFHQKMYITKFMAAYASVTISRWVTGRCSTARAMHCITNHDVWSWTSGLVSQLLFPLPMISASVGTVNEEKSMSRAVLSP